MAVGDPTVKVKFLGDASDLKRATDEADRKLKTMGESAGKIGKRVAIGIGVGGVAVGAFGVSAVSAASDLEEAQTKANVVFGESAKEVTDWAATASKAFGQSKQQALEAAGTYGNLFQAFGVGRDESTDMSKSLVELAADLASFNNTSVDDALLALRSGLSGETEPLKRFGIAVNDARLKEEAFKLGLIKSTKEALTPGAKAQAAYALIMKDSTLAQGDFARTADGLANKQRIMAARFADIRAEIGMKLLPVAVALTGWVTEKLIPSLRTASKWMEEHKGIVLAAGAAIGVILVAALIAWAAAAITAAAATIAAAAPVIAITLAIAALAAGIIYAYTHWGWFRAAVDAFADAIKAVFNFVKNNWENILTLLFGPVGIAVRLILEHWDKITSGFQAVKNFIGDRIGEIVSAFNAMKDFFVNIGGALKDAIVWPFEQAFNFVKGVYDKSIGPMIDAIQSIAGFGKGAIDVTKETIKQMRARGATDEQIKAHLGDKIGAIGTFASGGMVPGPLGMPRLAVVHGGERVLTPGQQRSGTTVIFELNGRELARAVVDESNNGGGLPIRIRPAS